MSYRKEYHSEILEACRQFRLPKEECYIQSLKRKDIIEIIRGLTSSTRLKNAYRLEIEENLPSIIADDLLVDNDSAHAPVLQILMTKMWSQVEQDETRYFSIKNYQKLLKDGILLEDFLQQQLEKIRQWNQKTEQSGLVLDILNHHTTENQVANYHHIDDLRKRYEHQEEILEKILIKCKELSLLSNIGKNRTQLAHDTLAPVVYRAFKDSNYPGQRATRILDNKIRNYHYNPDTYIDIYHLEVV